MLFEQLATYYKEFGWPMEQVEGRTIMSTAYASVAGEWAFVVATDEENKLIVMYARAPLYCPLNAIESMSEFFDLTNFNMTHGAWVIDRSDGEMRYRVGMDMGEMEPTKDYIRDMTFFTNITMETYLIGIQAITEGKASAQQALEMVFPKTQRSPSSEAL